VTADRVSGQYGLGFRNRATTDLLQ
jgi:hypothetical protein